MAAASNSKVILHRATSFGAEEAARAEALPTFNTIYGVLPKQPDKQAQRPVSLDQIQPWTL